MSDQPMVSATETKFVFQDGNLYQDGIHVLPWQLTEKEVMTYVPKEFQNTFIKAINRIPVPNKPDKV